VIVAAVMGLLALQAVWLVIHQATASCGRHAQRQRLQNNDKSKAPQLPVSALRWLSANSSRSGRPLGAGSSFTNS
jgi:hypothetical protein